MRDDGLATLEMAEIAASSDPLPHRGKQALAVLRRAVPSESAWMALVDPRHPDCTTPADADLVQSPRTFPAGPTREVLGLILEGCSNRQIACTLVVPQRTVAAHVQHIPARQVAPTRTHAAVRAERAGLHVPPRAEEGRSR